MPPRAQAGQNGREQQMAGPAIEGQRKKARIFLPRFFSLKTASPTVDWRQDGCCLRKCRPLGARSRLDSSSEQGHSRAESRSGAKLWPSRPHPLGDLGIHPAGLPSGCPRPGRDSDTFSCTRDLPRTDPPGGQIQQHQSKLQQAPQTGDAKIFCLCSVWFSYLFSLI
uniref:Uncharacterized protein n=1 Tax=Molossus molossus TaxID=27622 RepID=A0A7J8GKP0_MOLMO|nr:hypothetical protein HJG59_011536 [Molossus molossus]